MYVVGSCMETIIMVAGHPQLQVEFSLLSFNTQTHSVKEKF